MSLLTWAMFWGAFALLVLMLTLFALAVRRPGWGARLSVRQWLVWGGLGVPALLLPPLVGWALVTGERLAPKPDQTVPRIEVEARQWSWTFRYPEHGGHQSENVLHLPAGQLVDLAITSRDVIHSFWIPRLAGKLDAIPGHVNVLRLKADAPGVLGGQCAEFCGLEHARMRFAVQVHVPSDFAGALAGSAR